MQATTCSQLLIHSQARLDPRPPRIGLQALTCAAVLLRSAQRGSSIHLQGRAIAYTPWLAGVCYLPPALLLPDTRLRQYPDPVLPGVNLPWDRYGGDFGANAWSPAGGLSTRDLQPLQHVFAEARRAGAELVRWFVLCDGRAGISYDAGGVPTALQPVVLEDFQAALDLLEQHGLRMVPVLFDFTWSDARRQVNGVDLGGRAWVLRDPVARHRLWRVLDDLLAAFGRHPAIAMWDAWNEPEWLCAPWRPHARRLSRAHLRRCLGELVLHLRWHVTQPVTVGLASARGLPLCRALDLDVLQVHWYDPLERRTPLAVRPLVPWTGAPLVLGEFPTAGSARTGAQIVEIAQRAGYAAAWPWSLLATDASSDRDRALRAIDASAVRDASTR